MQYEKHPVTGETLLTEKQIENLISHRTIKEWAYVYHDKDTYDEEDELEDFERCKREYEALPDEEKALQLLDAYLEEHHRKKRGALKPPHWHIIARTDRNEDLHKIAEWLGVWEQYIEIPHMRRGEKDGKITFVDCLRYLTHESEKEQELGKYRYPDEVVKSNLDWRKRIEETDAKLAKMGTKSEKMYYREQVCYYGMTLKQVQAEAPEVYLKDRNMLKSLRNDYLSSTAPLPPFRVNIYVEGKGGLGKNFACKAIAKALYPDMEDEEEVYFEVGGKNVEFMKYAGQPVMIWNDRRAQQLLTTFGRGQVFDIFDDHPTNQTHSIKFGEMRLLNEVNIINGVEPYKEFIKHLADKYWDSNMWIEGEDDNQSYRRFPIILTLRECDYDILVNKGVLDKTRDYKSYYKQENIQGNFYNVAKQLSGTARDVILAEMTKPIVERVNQLKENDADKINDPNQIPEEFKSYGSYFDWLE